MRPLIRRLRRRAASADPAPSRLSYRLHRLSLTPSVRRLFTAGMPVLAVGVVATLTLADADRRQAIADWAGELKRQVQAREEFQVRAMSIAGASDAVATEIRTALALDFPVSSFELDLPEMQAEVTALDAVKSADLRIRSGHVLDLSVVEREPAVLWRHRGALTILDATGHRVQAVRARIDRPDLPLIAGSAADRAVPEALALFAAAGPLGPRIRGLLRVGKRRWSVMLEGGQKLLLPETDPVPALEHLVAVDAAKDLLARDVTQVDLRVPGRPTVRMRPDAARALRQIKISELGDD